MVDPPNITILILPELNSLRAQLLSSAFELKPNRGFQCSFDFSSRTHSPPCRGRYIGRSARFSSAVLSLFRISDDSDDSLTVGDGNATRSPNSSPPKKSRQDKKRAVTRTNIRKCELGRSVRCSLVVVCFIAARIAVYSAGILD